MAICVCRELGLGAHTNEVVAAYCLWDIPVEGNETYQMQYISGEEFWKSNAPGIGCWQLQHGLNAIYLLTPEWHALDPYIEPILFPPLFVLAALHNFVRHKLKTKSRMSISNDCLRKETPSSEEAVGNVHTQISGLWKNVKIQETQ